MKLTTMTQVTVDGVMQGNGAASDEDRKSGFERGGWAMGVFADDTHALITRTYQSADAFLFGRRTHELFAGYWGVMDRGSHPIADALNTTPKYLASTTITDPQWADTTALPGDLAAAIGELKTQPGGELQVHGSGTPLDLVESRADAKGVTIQVYRPAGRPRYAPASADPRR
jgi:dihydrofolate reductase